jgi:serine/threonine-protein kinase PpkA
MGLDQDTWTRMGVGQQQALIDDVKSKIALYQRFHDDVDRWVQLNLDGAPGDAVYPIPLDVLP